MSVTPFDILIEEQVDLYQELDWVNGSLTSSPPTETDRAREIVALARLDEIENELERISSPRK